MATATKDEIVALEKEYWDAMKCRDGKRSSQLSGKVSLTTGARGVTSIPKDKMGKMTEEGDWTLESYKCDDVEVITPAPDVAIIAYKVTQKATMGGKPQEPTAQLGFAAPMAGNVTRIAKPSFRMAKARRRFDAR